MSKKRQLSSSSSSSISIKRTSSTSSSSTYSQTSNLRKPHKHHKSHKHSHKHSKKRHKSDEKHKHKHKHKKHKHKHKHKGTISATNSWGKYGQIQESDLWAKKQEFQVWLMEVKNRSLEELPNWEEKQLFKDYMEDYNTATFTHKKYYDLQKWDMKMANKKSKKEGKCLERTNFNDEAARMAEIKKLRERRALDTLKEEYTTIKQDTEKVAAMKNQKLLHQKMEQLFKMGRTADAQKLQDILKPEA